MKALDKAIKALDVLNDENNDKAIMAILADAEKAVNMVSTQVRKLNQYEAKIKKYKWSNTQAQYVAEAAKELQEGINNAIAAIDRAKDITG